ncbi:hypothetical protein CSA08_01550 [Candidatus Gracilibacteria bacterium]|nr:MAG: hypothetical protein CSA08_01550 [Candidatus Gracilibacteria bacterium]
MLEKEIKILDIDSAEIVRKLQEFGGKKTFEGYIHDVYYDFPSGDNEHKTKMDNNKRMFRVRKKGETHLYTIKRKRKDRELVVKDEHEMEISDIDSFSSVLEKYGMKKTREKKKFRISFNINGVEFDIDKYEQIPALLEIEGESNTQVQKWIDKLGLSDKKQKKFGSRSLFKYYGVPYLHLMK